MKNKNPELKYVESRSIVAHMTRTIKKNIMLMLLIIPTTNQVIKQQVTHGFDRLIAASDLYIAV